MHLIKHAKKHNIKLATYTLPKQLSESDNQENNNSELFLLTPTINEQFHQLSQFIIKNIVMIIL